VRQRCTGLNRTGLAGPLQDNIAAEFSVAADASSQNRAKSDFGLQALKHSTTQSITFLKTKNNIAVLQNDAN